MLKSKCEFQYISSFSENKRFSKSKVLYYSRILTCFQLNTRAVTNLPAAKYVTNSIFPNCKAELIHYPFDIPINIRNRGRQSGISKGAHGCSILPHNGSFKYNHLKRDGMATLLNLPSESECKLSQQVDRSSVL